MINTNEDYPLNIIESDEISVKFLNMNDDQVITCQVQGKETNTIPLHEIYQTLQSKMSDQTYQLSMAM